MARTKATVRRMPDMTKKLPADFKKRTIYLFKIKQTLTAQKTVNITKNAQVVKTINVRRKSKYFRGKNKLIF